MADNTSTFTLRLKTEGMEQAQAGSKQIRDNLEGAQKAAQGTSTSRRAASSAAAMPTGAAGATAGISGSEVESYNRARGAGGAAGGTARDFADQARGLGGLVRLYATVAANAFAAAAAFNALSRAMDTANMVKGLDQLGAASGVALGSLSKRLVSATDGAVSLREAMEATVKASSAGLNTDQILQLGDVSKKAAQALGLNMTDALSRLTRGITKLEPELLDELGIFVKIDDATSKYALSVGKSTSALTDFERRQAFANAVLEQGKKKFDEIKIDSNPYTKLAASFQNLTQSILDFVNKGLAPVAKFLSENTTVLAAVFALVALKLTQAALPALGQWQEGLVKAAQTAKASAREINTSFGEAFVQRWTDKLRIPELEKQVEQGKKSLQSLASMVDLQGMGRGKAALGRVLAGGTEAKDIKTLNNLLGEQTKKYEEALEANNKRQNATTRALQSEISFYQTAIEKSKTLAASTRELTEANKQFNKSAIEAPSGLGERAREMTAKAAGRKAQMYSALADVSTNVLQEGIGSALKKLNTQLNVEGVGYIRRFTGLAIGAFSAVTTGIGIFANAVSGYLAIFTFLITLGAGILNFFSNTKKESEATSEAFGRLEGGLKTTRDTLERISMMKDPLEQISVESVQAKANALKELGDAAVLTQTRAFDEISKMNPGDKIINWFKGFLDADVQTKLASNITESITQALKLAQEGPAKQQAKKTLEAILGADVNAGNLSKRVSTLVQTGDREKIAKVTEAIQQLGFQSSVSAAKGTEFKESIKKLTTDIQEFNKSLTPTDAISKFAQDGIESAQKLKLALDDPTQSIQAMITASSDINLLAIFPPDVAAVLMNYNSALKGFAVSLENVSELAPETKKEITALEKELNYLTSGVARRDRGIPEGEGRQTEATKQARAALDVQVEETRKKLQDLKNIPIELRAKIQADIDPIKSAFDSAVRSSLVKSSEMMGSRIAAEVSKAQTIVLSTLAGMIGDTDVGIKLRTEIELKGIDASNAVARESALLAMEVDKLRIQMERRNLIEEKRELGTGDKSQDISARKQQIDTRLEQLKKAENIYTEGPGKLTSKGLRSELKGGQDVSADLMQAVQKFESLNAAGATAAAQKESVRIKERIDLLVSAQKKEMEILDIKIKQGSLSISALNTQKEMGLISDEEYARKSNTLALEQISNDFDKKKQAAADEYNKLSAIGSELFKAGKTAAADELETLAKNKKLQTEKLTEQEKQVALQEQQSRSARLLIEIEQKKFDKITKEIEFRDSLLKAEDDLAKTKLDSNRQEIEYLANTDRVSKEYAANRIAEIARENQAIGYQSQLREATAQRDAATRAALFKAAEQEIKTGGQDDGAAMIAANKEIERANQLYAIRTAAIEGSNTSATRAIEITRQQSVETAKQTEELKKQAEILGLFQGIADTLAQAFGKTGEVLGKFVGTIGEVIDSQETYNKKRAEQSKILDEVAGKADSGYLSPDDMAKMNQATKTRNDLDKKNARDELTNNAKLVGAAKGLFKEKSTGYKLLAGIEKAMHIYKMATWAKEQAADLMRTASSSSNALVRGLADGAAAVAKTLSSIPFPANVAAAAAVAAIVKSLFGGGPDVQPGGFTAEEQQKVQGTGQVYRDGKLVDTGAGVLGDSTAKSESVAKGISLLEKYSFKNLEYSNDMLDALKAIKKNTESFAGSLLKAIPGINLTPETLKSGNWLFGKETTETLDRGIKIVGNVGEIIDRSAQLLQYTNTKTTDSGFLGIFGGGTTYGGDPGKPIEGATKLQKDLSLVFSSMGKALGTAAKDLGISTAEEVNAAFRSIDLTEQLKVSLMGLTGTDAAEALLSVISSGLDTAALALFPSLEKFQQVGESFGDTIIRLASDTRAVSLSFEELGMALPKLAEQGAKPTTEQLNRVTAAQAKYNTALAATKAVTDVLQQGGEGPDYYVQVTGSLAATAALASALIELTSAQSAVTVASNSLTTRNIDLVQSYIDAAGGLDEFIEKNRFFAENFLTEAERLAPIQSRVNAELARLNPQLTALGITSVTTRDQFKGAVFAAKGLGEAGVDLYSSLMNLAPAFVEVNKAVEKLTELSTEDFISRINAARVKALQLTDPTAAIALQRKLELEQFDKYTDAQKTVLKSQQTYLNALEDEFSAKDKLVKRRDLLKSIFNDFGKAIDNLTNYKNTLLAGDLSTLLPIDKYNLAKTQFEELLTSININPETEAQAKAQLEAVSKLPQVSDAFLQASRIVNASSGAYISDFEAVTKALDVSKDKLKEVQTDIQVHQLDALKAAGISLEDIAESSKSTASLITEYTAVQLATNTAFNGLVTASETQVGEVKAALTNLANEFDKFRTSMLGTDGFKGIKTALVGENTNTSLVSTVDKVTTAVNTSTQATGAQTAAVVTATLTSGGQVVTAVEESADTTEQQTWVNNAFTSIITKYNSKLPGNLVFIP